MQGKYIKISILTLTLLLTFMAKAVQSSEENNRSIDLNLAVNEAAVSFLGVSQGEATLLQGASGHFYLINTGHKNAREDLQKILDSFNVESIHTIFLSSTDSGYIGNLSWLIDQYNIGKIKTFPSIKDELCEGATKKFCFMIQEFEPGARVTFNNFNLKRLSSTKSLLLTFGSHQFLFLNNHQFLNPSALKKMGQITLLKVGNYGKQQMNSSLLESLDPDVAIIFHQENRVPNETLIEQLETAMVDVYRPYKMGTIIFKMDPEEYDFDYITL